MASLVVSICLHTLSNKIVLRASFSSAEATLSMKEEENNIESRPPPVANGKLVFVDYSAVYFLPKIFVPLKNILAM